MQSLHRVSLLRASKFPYLQGTNMSTKSETCDARRAHIALVIHMAKAGDNPSAAKSEWVRTVSERLSIEPKDVAEAESMTLEEIRPILSHSIGDR
ncbi:MAG: hypothetical protein MK100_08470, partial [Phycisphaerales bacterium]|nr:hypothetical protein [Phycisphaerales bacterium]